MEEPSFGAEATREIGEPLRIYIDVHVHLNGSTLTPTAVAGPARDATYGPLPARVDAPRRPVLKNLALVASVLTLGFVSFRFGGLSSQPHAADASLVAAAPMPVAPLPETLTRELRQPPKITPPPGASANPTALSGPAAFGLHE